jgi:hypothetical protein
VSVRKRNLKERKREYGVILGGLVLSCYGSAYAPLAVSPLDLAGTEIVAAQNSRLEEMRRVAYFFSAEAWGGLPFTDAQKQQVMVQAMTQRSLVRMELQVTHLLSTSDARVSAFTAVYEIDGRTEPPRLRAGYTLELLVPHSGSPLTVELINGDTGKINLVEIAPEGAL